jgi:rhamnosyltransferase
MTEHDARIGGEYQCEYPGAVSPDRARAGVFAVIVTYFPDESLLVRINSLATQVDSLLVVDNTPPNRRSAALADLPDIISNLLYRSNDTNLGIATALNQGLHEAVARRYRWMLTLDQDTEWYSDMVPTLLNAASSAPYGTRIIGGNYYDPRLKRFAASVDGQAALTPVKTVITSGSLVDSMFVRDIGGFRDDYFIDQVDHELCLRTRKLGAGVAITRRPVMTHTVGGADGIRIPLTSATLPGHSALRKYYIARNSAVTLMGYWRHEPIWCLKRLAKMMIGVAGVLVGEHDKVIKLRALLAGWRDAISGRMGPCTLNWLHPDTTVGTKRPASKPQD